MANVTGEIEVCELYKEVKTFKVSHLAGDAILKIYVFCGRGYEDRAEIFENAFKPTFFNGSSTATAAAATAPTLSRDDPIVKSMLPFFSMHELENIARDNIDVAFICEHRIHLDDSIETIKRKILRVLRSHPSSSDADSDQSNNDLSTSEMYLFGKRCVPHFTTQMAHDALSRSGKDVITKVKMDNFVSNIDNINSPGVGLSAFKEDCHRKYNSGSSVLNAAEHDMLDDDDEAVDYPDSDVSVAEHFDKDERVYTFNDVRDLNLERKMQIMNVCIGHEFVEDKSVHSFSINPFTRSTSYDPALLQASVVAVDNNSLLLMDCGLLLFNTIFLCTALDVLDFSASVDHKNDKTGVYALHIYFPRLVKRMNASLSGSGVSLEAYKGSDLTSALAENVRADLNDKAFDQDCANINFFYDVYDNRVTSVTNPSGEARTFSYVEQGIRSLCAAIPAKRATPFPIDTIFKIVCTTSELLFVKLNYARRDNMFKTHAPRINKYGNRVPFFDSSKFGHVNNDLCKRANCVSLFFSNFEGGSTTLKGYCNYLICEIDTGGQVFITLDLHTLCNVGEIDEIIRTTLNPVIKKMNYAFEQSGIELPLFTSVYDTDTVRTIKMKYEIRAKTDHKINIGAILGCSSSIFTPPELHHQTKNETVMQIKRVSNFDSDNLVEESVKDGIRIIINHNSRPDKGGANLAITIDHINNIYYLATIPIYVDALLRIFHDENTNMPKDVIQRMCFGAKPGVDKPQPVAPVVAAVAPVVAAVAPGGVGSDDEPAFFLRDLLKGPDSESESDSESGSSSSSNSDSDSESGSNSDSNSEGGSKSNPKYGGAKAANVKDKGNIKKDEKKNWVLDRLQSHDKVLFFLSTARNEKGYARCCQKRSKAHNHSQPVMLTDDEMVRLDSVFATRSDEYPLHAEDMSKTSFYRYSEKLSKNGKDVVVVNAYRFGSTKQTARWYICPRFWNFVDNAFVSEADAAKYYNSATRKYDLPDNIYEFESGVDPYIKLYPGFAEQLHNDELIRMPCCFTTSLHNIRYSSTEEAVAKKAKHTGAADAIPDWKVKAFETGLIPTLDEINGKRYDDGVGAAAASNTVASAASATILDATKRSLKPHQLGHLPVAVQKFFYFNGEECEAAGRECILRRGVEKGKRSAQSIIGAIAYLYAEYCTIRDGLRQTIERPTNKDMRRIILDAITLDAFISYHNGSLVTQFQNQPGDYGDGDGDGDIANYRIPADYETSIVYAQLMKSAENDDDPVASSQKKILLNKQCVAVDRFKKYFDDDDSLIDSSLMWDIVSTPNPKLFAEGNNMIILELPDNDDTHNVRIVCPSNHYSVHFFDRRKPTFFLIKRDVYEPVCLHHISRSTTTVMYRFDLAMLSESRSKMVSNIKYAINFAKRVQNKYCAPPDTKFHAYYKMNHPAKYIERVLKHNNYAIQFQVLNYDNRVIGFIVIKQEKGDGSRTIIGPGYIPTESSELLVDFNRLDRADAAAALQPQPPPLQIPKYDPVYTDDSSIPWQGLVATTAFLKYVSEDTKSKLSCLPRVKVLDDSGRMTIGVITETNQFIRTKLEENRPDEYDDGRQVSSASAVGVKGDHFMIDKKIMLNRAQKPKQPNAVIRNFKLDSNFYSAFRSTARFALNRYLTPETRRHRRIIERVLADRSKSYADKLHSIEAQLRPLMSGYVKFIEYDTGAISEVFTCITNNTNKSCGGESPTYCTYDPSTKKCCLQIPKYKLSTSSGSGAGAGAGAGAGGNENEPVYYSRLADELIRHERARLFLLNEAAHLFTSRMRYRVCEDEIILMQSDIDNKFFKQVKNMPDAIETKMGKIKPKPNTSFFNAKMADNAPPNYDKSFMREVRPAREYASSDSNDADANGVDESLPQVVNLPVSRHVGEGLNDPSKFEMNVFTGMFPRLQQQQQQRGGSSVEDIPETVNGAVTFAVMANILHLEKRIDDDEHVNTIKAVLCDIYADLKRFEHSGISSPLNKICRIFRRFGMPDNADAVLKKLYSDEMLIRSNRYVLTPFDMWLLADHYKIPIVIMSDANADADADAAAFHQIFFGTGGRTLYTTHEPNNGCYVVVSTRPDQAFPVYGVLSYTPADGSVPTHAIPISALQPIDKPPYSNPVEFLDNVLHLSVNGPAITTTPTSAANSSDTDSYFSDFVSDVDSDVDSNLSDASDASPAPASPAPASPAVPTHPRPVPVPSIISAAPVPALTTKNPQQNLDTTQIIMDALSVLEKVTKKTDDIVESRTVSDLQAKLAQMSNPRPETAATAGTDAEKEM